MVKYLSFSPVGDIIPYLPAILSMKSLLARVFCAALISSHSSKSKRYNLLSITGQFEGEIEVFFGIFRKSYPFPIVQMEKR